MSVQLAKLQNTADYPAGKERLYYKVEYGSAYGRKTVVEWSPLGLVREDQDFVDGLVFESRSDIKTIDETYEMVHGKRRVCRNYANEIILAFRNAHGGMIELIVRAYNDGAAFRYRFPEKDNVRRTVKNEATGFALPADARVTMQPYDKPAKVTPAYEEYYEDNIAVGMSSPSDAGWAFPVLFNTKGGAYWGLITESDMVDNYFGGRLNKDAAKGVYRIRMPEPGDGNGMGSVEPSSTLPWMTPWRVIVVGDSLATIVESTLVTDLSAKSTIEETDWIVPGRVAWSWCSDPSSPRDCTKQKKFIDLAAEMGWEYVLVDANWTIMKNGTIHDVIAHAKSKGVGVLLWYNSGGPHNYVSEKPRGLMYYQDIRRREFELLRSWGVKGVKVDFFHSDKQDVIGLYHEIMKDAAEAKIMVNFHGCTLPRGWSRTYPHLMTMEGVRGEECYIFDGQYPEKAPVQNTILPFTRNAVGPMDYTPVVFSNNNHPHLTTYAHELALSVIFESGWVHFADSVESYRSLPGEPKQFLKDVPAAWDDTRFVAGYPGKSIILARRKGQDWYVAGINGEKNGSWGTVSAEAFLDEGSYEMTWIGDGEGGKSFRIEKRTVRHDDVILANMLPYGGFAVRLHKIEK
jgi:hypothetical protein